MVWFNVNCRYPTYPLPSVTMALLTSVAMALMMMMQVQGQNLTSDGCGTTKGCFSDPDSCSNPVSCNYFLSWSVDADGNNVFEMTGDASSYVAVGFSKSGKMSESDVYACTSNNDVARSRNTMGNVNDPSHQLKGVSDITVSTTNGRIQCQFTRQATLNDGDDTYYDLTGGNQYAIIMAKSDSALASDGNIQYHYGGRKQSSGRTDFSEAGNVGADNSKIMLQKAHGSLMIIAWVGLASIGITIARYFKPLSSGTQICDDKPIWFAVHRFVMVSALVFTVIAFILIFVAEQGFVDTTAKDVSGKSKVTHAIFGIIITILAIVNPIMAIFRPHPGESNRPIFNWAHRIVGMSAHGLSMITICLGLGAGNSRPLISGLSSSAFYVMIVFIIIHYVFWVVMEFINCCKSDSGNDVPMQETTDYSAGNGSSTDQLNTPSNMDSEKNSSLTTMLFLGYAAVIILFVFILFIFVAVAEP